MRGHRLCPVAHRDVSFTRHSTWGQSHRTELGLEVMSTHGRWIWGSAIWRFLNERLLKETDILILRRMTVQNVFERCHISSVTAA